MTEPKEIPAVEGVVERVRRMIGTPTETGCWPWSGSVNSAGYGTISIGSRSSQKRHTAHRLVWTLFVGPLEETSFLLHSCDNKLCVNPGHLRIGTQAENMIDMATRNRGTKSRKGLQFGVKARRNGRFQAQVAFQKKEASSRHLRHCEASFCGRRGRQAVVVSE